jgi:hypothetical protein
MINVTKNKNFEVPPAGIFTGLPFERQAQSATSMTAKKSKTA